MPRNIEVKARLRSADDIAAQAAAIAMAGPTEVHQDDTFSRCNTGRFKLRTFSAQEGELIFYQRAKTLGLRS